MKRFKLFFNFLVLLTIFSTIFQSIAEASTILVPKSKKSLKIDQNKLRRFQILSYDEILNFIESLKTDELEEKYSLEELNKINHWLAISARQGILSEDPNEIISLEEDIERLLFDGDERDYSVASAYGGDYLIRPAICYNQKNQYVLINDISHAWKNTVKFVKKHTKEVLIGTVMVAGAVITYFSLSNSEDSTPNYHDYQTSAPTPKPEENQITGPSPPLFSDSQPNVSLEYTENNSSQPHLDDIDSILPPDIQQQDLIADVFIKKSGDSLSNVFDTQILDFKNQLQKELEINSNDFASLEAPSSWLKTKEVIRDYGADFAHKILDEISDEIKIFPQLINEIQDVCKKVTPDEIITDIPKDTVLSVDTNVIEGFEEKVFEGHKKIDEFFAVNQSEQYTKDAKENPAIEIVQGILPPPDGIFGVFNFKKFSNAGKIHDRGGLTKAGRALTKHGGREGSAFPKPLGNPEQINLQGQEILESILNNPKSVIINDIDKGFEIYSPDGRGVYFKKDGTFRGFVEWTKK